MLWVSGTCFFFQSGNGSISQVHQLESKDMNLSQAGKPLNSFYKCSWDHRADLRGNKFSQCSKRITPSQLIFQPMTASFLGECIRMKFSSRMWGIPGYPKIPARS